MGIDDEAEMAPIASAACFRPMGTVTILVQQQYTSWRTIGSSEASLSILSRAGNADVIFIWPRQ
jgi:hypothetical protein